jgi:hypothetical protein
MILLNHIKPASSKIVQVQQNGSQIDLFSFSSSVEKLINICANFGGSIQTFADLCGFS